MKQFLPWFNRRFQVPAQCRQSAFRPLEPGLRLEQILCFKHRRRVARDNTVKFYRHTLQLLPSQQHRSYAGATVVVLQGLDGQLSLQRQGRIIASQDAPPSPGALRAGKGSSTGVTVPNSDPKGPADSSSTVPEPLWVRMYEAKERNPDIDGEEVAAMTDSPRCGNPPSFRGRGGRQYRRPSEGDCPFEEWRRSWEFTERQ